MRGVSKRSALAPGGHYLMLCLRDQHPGGQGPRRVTRNEITASFAEGWHVDSIEPATLDNPAGPGAIRAWLAVITRRADAC